LVALEASDLKRVREAAERLAEALKFGAKDQTCLSVEERESSGQPS
jgi:hypothetical protein